MNIDWQRILARARAIIVQPVPTWRVIAGETETTNSLYRNYIAVMAAIPPLFSFIKGSILGFGSMFGVSIRIGIVAGLGSMLVTYLLSLLAIYLFALIIEALAPRFDGQRDRVQALKTVAYAFTASCIAGAAVIIPGIGSLVYFAGVVYSFYLLYLGVQVTLAVPVEKAAGFTAVCVVAGIVLGILVARLAAIFTGSVMPLGGYAFW